MGRMLQRYRGVGLSEAIRHWREGRLSGLMCRGFQVTFGDDVSRINL